ncbi:hypothetical protein Fcan01_11301 [Folsomia candida]|uniref:SWIM-type domain-containing protein n=1 Tax=Folsomia candida TaxID=158441 RepID=A0A226ECY7_FOLCA|nr:hypothetical protein Fcan01_11301 [Folsomia candida]
MLTRRIIWQTVDAEELVDFPRLSMDDLREIKLGSYQINLAPSYTAEHLFSDGKYKLSYHKEKKFRNILHVRLQSRQRYSPFDEGSESITGWYCTCPCGARNVGACAHISSCIWYLGYARHLDAVRYPAQDLFRNVLDARDVPSGSDGNDGSDEDEECSEGVSSSSSVPFISKMSICGCRNQ